MDSDFIRGQAVFLARYARLVRQVAGTLARRLPAKVDIDDLIQDGYVGLLVGYQRAAIKCLRFDDEAHIGLRVRGAMMDGLRQADHCNRETRAQMRHIESAIRQLEQSLGRAPRAAEIAAALDIPLSTYWRIVAVARDNDLASIEDCEASLFADMDNAATEDPMTLLERQEGLNALISAIGELSDKEFAVLNAYYSEGENLKAIGRRLKLTEARICQIKKRAISRLRSQIGEVAPSIRKVLITNEGSGRVAGLD